jgi:hypothetical protein
MVKWALRYLGTVPPKWKVREIYLELFNEVGVGSGEDAVMVHLGAGALLVVGGKAVSPLVEEDFPHLDLREAGPEPDAPPLVAGVSDEEAVAVCWEGLYNCDADRLWEGMVPAEPPQDALGV